MESDSWENSFWISDDFEQDSFFCSLCGIVRVDSFVSAIVGSIDCYVALYLSLSLKYKDSGSSWSELASDSLSLLELVSFQSMFNY